MFHAVKTALTPEAKGPARVGVMTLEVLRDRTPHRLRAGDAFPATPCIQGFEVCRWQVHDRAHDVIILRHQMMKVRGTFARIGDDSGSC